MNPVRKAIESMYKGVCTIKEYRDVKDPNTHISRKQEVEVIKDQPCRLSYSKITSTGQSNSSSPVIQTIKLFISPDIEVKPGSKLIVTQNGKTTEFARSGEPALYTHHQEITLELFKEYA
ncbi:hypothetical protein ABE096_13960 [Robertmurraya massiliosenegalensis]|uniref:hypothetical protein n=1 Tax=Robertmurraya TaxID=2837507 RepID=UPI0039A6662F